MIRTSKVIRVIIYDYESPQAAARDIERWQVSYNAKLITPKVSIHSVIVAADNITCLQCGERITNNKDFICNSCRKILEELATMSNI